MLRALRLFALVVAVAVAAAWIADRPGTVAIEWLSWRIETTAAVLAIGVLLLAVGAALLYRGWRGLIGLPRRWREARVERRRRAGYLALTRGLVAVAAGDAEEAKQQAKRADGLLDDPPLTMLLAAQAAQLAGDETAAERFFHAMLEKPETEFLGVRGLLAQALRRGDHAGALDLARRAWRLRPASAWVSTNLFELEARAGRWLDAEQTLEDGRRRRLINDAASRRRRAALLVEGSRAAEAAGDGDEALRRARRAVDLDPSLAPAAARAARLLAAAGKRRRAARIVQAAWAATPHPDLLGPWLAARRPANRLAAVGEVKRLTDANPDHPESRLARAEAALAAALWGEARSELRAIADPDARVWRMMAEIAERDSGDAAEVHDCLRRAADAPPAPAWLCDACGHAEAEWTAVCSRCGAFDRAAWRRPERAVAVHGPIGGEPGPLSGPVPPSTPVSAGVEAAALAARAGGA